MGRRALPKISPEVDLSAHLFFLEEISIPFDPQSLFATSQPLEVEIGSGKGHFVLRHSQRHEDRNYLGNEIAKKYARFAAYRLAKHERPNARMISGDGIKLFAELLPAASCAGVHVYFPDPWWKERHRRRRVLQPQFISDVERVLEPGGEFHFWSDVEEYFEKSLKLIGEHTGLQGPYGVNPSEPEHDMDYRTHFERRMRLNDHDVFRSRFCKPKR